MWVTLELVAWIVFQERGASLVQFKSVETTDHSTGPVRVSNGWPFVFRGQKLHSQIVNDAIFWTMSHREACKTDMLVQNINYFTFLLPPDICPPTSDYPTSLSHKYPQPLAFQETDLRLVLPFPCLATLWINAFSAVNLSISEFGWLSTRQADLVWSCQRLNRQNSKWKSSVRMYFTNTFCC